MQESLETILSVNKVRVKANHGWYASERKIGGMYTVSVRIFSSIQRIENFGDIGDTINYEIIYEIIIRHMKKEYKLIETCCKAMWNELKPLAENNVWEVVVEKEDVPIKFIGNTSFTVKG